MVTVVLCLLPGATRAGQERLTALLTFDAENISPNVACDGQLRLSDGRLTIREWMHDDKDAVDGPSYRLQTWHDAKTAEAAKRPVVQRSTFSKGLLLQVEGPRQATLSGTTRLGNFELTLDQLRKQRNMSLLDGKIQVQWIPNVARLTGDQAEEEYPSLAVLPNGQTAVAYVAWDGQRDRVVLQQGDQTRMITDARGDYLEPRCAVDGQGKLWVVWAANDGRRWDLWMRSDAGPVKLTNNGRNNFGPRMARDRQGRLWLAWQTVADDLHYEVMLARLDSSGLAQPINVSQHPADDWEPSLCTTPDGRIVVAWDSYRNGSFDVLLREFAIGPDGAARPSGEPRPVAASVQREAHATVASDSQGRVWLAWEVANEDWGKHPQPRATLHQSRAVDLACYFNGRLHRLPADFMQSLPRGMKKFAEYPQIAVDGHDRVWVVFRVENEVRPVYKSPKVPRNVQSYGMWHLFASQFDGRRWTAPVLLADSNGRQDMRVDVACDAGGSLLVAYGADGRTRRLPYVPVDYDVYLASLAGFEVPAAPFSWTDAGDLGRVQLVKPDPELDPLPRQWSVGAKAYRLVIGDTHRHTDISRCSNGYDGSLQDAYRYALDASGLDWLAISDHDQDILKHRADRDQRPRQDYDWWRSQKYCDLYTIPGRFVALYGYEHGGSYQARGGHKNVVAARRGAPVQEVDAPHALFAALAGSGAIVIPHQLADAGSRTDWDKWNADFERVGEIFQARGSYEFEGCPRAAQLFNSGFSMWDALAKGVRIGIIASSDHGQTHQARAGAYVEELPGQQGFSREAILAALRARRAFGATIAAAMQVQIAGHPLGEEFTVPGSPKIEAQIAAPAPIGRLEVVRDGRFVYSQQPNAKQAALVFEDRDLQPGQAAYYYVRAQIGTDDFAWSSPLWVARSK